MAEVGHHRALIQVRPPTEEETRFFALADNGRVAVLACVHTDLPGRRRRAGAVPAHLQATRSQIAAAALPIPSGSGATG